MHFPEEQLTTYLRVFTPEERIDALLDEVAQAAIDSDAQETVELYALAHGLMPPDERRTPDIEAVVLVEEVGLGVDDVARVLEIDRAQVEAAVAEAWIAVEDGPPPPQSPPVASAPVDGVATHEPAGDVLVVDRPAPSPAGPRTRGDARGRRRSAAAAAEVVTAPEMPESRRLARLGWRTTMALLTGVLLVVLAVAVFSEAGQQRIAAQGFNPIIAFGSLVGLLVIGGLLVVLGDEDRG